MANLYGAYKAAGTAGGAYASSLQDIMNIGYEKEHSKQMFDISQEARDRKFAAGQMALATVETIAGGIAEQEEASKDIKKTFPGAEQTYGETKIWDLINPFKMEGGKIKWEGFGKAPGLGKGETAWGEVGERLGVLFGGKERKWTIPGREGEYKQSGLLARAKQSTWEELGGEGAAECPDGQFRDASGKCVLNASFIQGAPEEFHF